MMRLGVWRQAIVRRTPTQCSSSDGGDGRSGPRLDPSFPQTTGLSSRTSARDELRSSAWSKQEISTGPSRSCERGATSPHQHYVSSSSSRQWIDTGSDRPPEAQNPVAPQTGENTGSTSSSEWSRLVQYRQMCRRLQPNSSISRSVVTGSMSLRHSPPRPNAQPIASGSASRQSSPEARWMNPNRSTHAVRIAS